MTAAGAPRLILHIGLRKTGSTALQTALARAGAPLAAAGCRYCPDPSNALAAQGGVTTGNGRDFYHVLRPEKLKRPDPRVVDRRLASLAADRSVSAHIVSSENFAAAPLERIEDFAERARRRGIAVSVICFVRDLYPHAFSTWVQGVKSGNMTRDWDAFCGGYVTNVGDQVERYARVFGEAFTALNYKETRRGVLTAFCRAAGIDIDAAAIDADLPGVNRSLALEEAEVLAFIRRHLDRRGVAAGRRRELCLALSDRMTRTAFDGARISNAASEAARAAFARNNQPALDQVNRVMRGEPVALFGPARADIEDARALELNEALDRRLAHLAPVVDMLLERRAGRAPRPLPERLSGALRKFMLKVTAP